MNRASGVLLPVSSLWGNYSEGAFGRPAFEFIDFLADCGFSYWQMLPFCIPDSYHSPYASVGSFSINPNFIDLETLHRQGLLTEEEIRRAEQTSPWLCEFDRLDRERISLLKTAYSRVKDRNEIGRFLTAYPKTESFCRYMALKTSNGGKGFREWTETLPDEEEYRFWAFVQFTAFSQWQDVRCYAREKGIRLIGDLPIYVSSESADVYANPEQFQLDADLNPASVAGVPPDYFAADGQRWGNPLYDWDAMKADGYQWWRERLRFMNDLFDGIRIDHFRGLESYYSIPAEEKTARNGVWKPGPGMDFIRVIREECANQLIIAEDLGDITPEVHQLVKESGFPGMRVFQFAFLGDRSSPHLPHNYEENCVAYTGTHDNNTLLGYVWDLDDATRKEVFAYCGYEHPDWDHGYDAILRTMFASHANLVVFPLQDLLLYGKDTRLNQPGTSEKNWAFRITKEQVDTVDREKFRRWNERYGRN